MHLHRFVPFVPSIIRFFSFFALSVLALASLAPSMKKRNLNCCCSCRPLTLLLSRNYQMIIHFSILFCHAHSPTLFFHLSGSLVCCQFVHINRPPSFPPRPPPSPSLTHLLNLIQAFSSSFNISCLKHECRIRQHDTAVQAHRSFPPSYEFSVVRDGRNVVVIIHKRHTGPGHIIKLRSKPLIVSGRLVDALPLVVSHEGVAADLKLKKG